jgi:hypothetical protein
VTHGEWVIPVWSKTQSLAGSVPTPYIWDDRVDLYEVADAILKMYNTSKQQRNLNGLAGRSYFINKSGLTTENMCKQLVNGIDTTLRNWKPINKFQIFKIN